MMVLIDEVLRQLRAEIKTKYEMRTSLKKNVFHLFTWCAFEMIHP